MKFLEVALVITLAVLVADVVAEVKPVSQLWYFKLLFLHRQILEEV